MSEKFRIKNTVTIVKFLRRSEGGFCFCPSLPPSPAPQPAEQVVRPIAPLTHSLAARNFPSRPVSGFLKSEYLFFCVLQLGSWVKIFGKTRPGVVSLDCNTIAADDHVAASK